MAVIIEVNNISDNELQKKLAELNSHIPVGNKKLDAKKFTGKVKSFGDGTEYQKKIRDEWE